MSKRLQGIVIGLIASALLAGTVAYAVTVVPPEAGDVYYGCFSTLNKLKASTVQVNSEPATCPAATDVVRSWGAQGDTGPVGQTGPAGPEGPEGPPGPAVTPAVRVIDVSAEITSQDVEIGPGQTHTYPVFESADCAAISASVEDMAVSYSNFSSYGYRYAQLYGGRTENDLGMRSSQILEGNSLPFTFYAGSSHIVLPSMPVSALGIQNSDQYRTVTIGRVYAYCYPY